jgi:Protein of unknown function (DUF1091)
VFHPGSIRYVQDYCAMMKGEETIITKTFSKSYKILKDILQPCPVRGKHGIENVPFDSSLIPSNLLPTGDYRMDMRQYNGLNQTIFVVQYFMTIKNPFF